VKRLSRKNHQSLAMWLSIAYFTMPWSLNTLGSHLVRFCGRIQLYWKMIVFVRYGVLMLTMARQSERKYPLHSLCHVPSHSPALQYATCEQARRRTILVKLSSLSRILRVTLATYCPPLQITIRTSRTRLLGWHVRLPGSTTWESSIIHFARLGACAQRFPKPFILHEP
jgi:hypothetical protein